MAARKSPAFISLGRRPVTATPEECEGNPRARSAKLRVATRTGAAPGKTDRKAMGMPLLKGDR